jgi:outer membrane protein, protease secretion system
MVKKNKIIIGLMISFALVGVEAKELDFIYLVDQTMNNSNVVNSHKEKKSSAEYKKNMADSALLPQINATGNIWGNKLTSEQTIKSNGSSFDYTNTKKFRSEDVNINMKMPIYRPIIWANRKQAGTLLTIAEMQEEDSKQEVIVKLADTYKELINQKNELEANEKLYAYASRILEGQEKNFKAGISTITDIDEAKSKQELTYLKLMKAKKEFNDSKNKIISLCKCQVNDFKTPHYNKMLELNLENYNYWEQLLLSENLKIKIKQEELQSSKYEIEKINSDLLPTVDLVAQHSLSNKTNLQALNTSYNQSQIGLQVNIPIFTSGYNSNSKKVAIHESYAVQYQLDEIRRTLLLDLSNNLENINYTKLEITTIKKAIESLEKSNFSIQKGVEVGTRNLFELLDAHKEKVKTELDLQKTLALQFKNLVELLYLTNSLNEENLSFLNNLLE